MGLDFVRKTESAQKIGDLMERTEGSLPKNEPEFNVSYNNLDNTTDKIYTGSQPSVVETYKGDVREKILSGDKSLKPISIKNDDYIFNFSINENGIESTEIFYRRGSGDVHSKVYLGHIEDIKDCDESKLFKINYCRDGYSETFHRSPEGLTYVHCTDNSTYKFTKVSQDGKVYLFNGFVTNINDPNNDLRQITFKRGNEVVVYDYTCKDSENITIVKTVSPNKDVHVLCYKGYYKPDEPLPSGDKLVRETFGNIGSAEIQVIDYQWDKQGRCVSVLRSPYNSEQCATETCYQYDKNGGKIETNYSLGFGGKRCLNSTKIYGSDGTLLKEYTPTTYNPEYSQKGTEQIDVDGNGGADTVTTYLDANGQIVREDIVLHNSVGLEHGSLQRFYANGKLVCQSIDSNRFFDGDIDDAITRQGKQEDCWLLTEMNELQIRDPKGFQNCIKLNEDGTVDVTLHFINGHTNKRENYVVRDISINQIKDAQEKGLLSKEGSDWDGLAVEYALLQRYGNNIIPQGFEDPADLTGVERTIKERISSMGQLEGGKLPDGSYIYSGHVYMKTKTSNGKDAFINPHNNGVLIVPMQYDDSISRKLMSVGQKIVTDMLN